MTAWLANTLWQNLMLPDTLCWQRATHAVEATQQRILQHILSTNAASAFGRAHHFAQLRSVAAFQEQVPVRCYDELQPYIARAAQGEPGVLTCAAPVCFEQSSGSTHAIKLLPFTPAFLREVRAGIAPWLTSMFRTVPAVRRGRAYWSLSPCLRAPMRTPGGVPIGLADDSAYFGAWARGLVRRLMIVPPAVTGVQAHDDWRYVTLAFLLAAHDLAFVSIWNPSFLALLLDPLQAWLPALIKDVADGTLTVPSGARTPALAALAASLGPQRERARELEKHSATAAGTITELLQRLWPHLAVISCWADATAAGPAQALARLLPHAAVLPKGLLATEGVVSIALPHGCGGALAVTSHFLEFAPVDGGAPRTAWQLELGREYVVILTTGAGLYRYRLGDVVRVTGFLHGCPRVCFVARDNHSSDVCGEKLSEPFVTRVLQDVLPGASSSFALIMPERPSAPTRYLLCLAPSEPLASDALATLTTAFETALCANPQYRYCRQLGQLQHVGLRVLPCTPAVARMRYIEACRRRGQRVGAIKSCCLSAHADWQVLFHDGEASAGARP